MPTFSLIFLGKASFFCLPPKILTPPPCKKMDGPLKAHKRQNWFVNVLINHLSKVYIDEFCPFATSCKVKSVWVSVLCGFDVWMCKHTQHIWYTVIKTSSIELKSQLLKTSYFRSKSLQSIMLTAKNYFSLWEFHTLRCVSISVCRMTVNISSKIYEIWPPATKKGVKNRSPINIRPKTPLNKCLNRVPIGFFNPPPPTPTNKEFFHNPVILMFSIEGSVHFADP